MAFIEWKESYNCGVKEIDNQHRGMFDLIDKLFKTEYLYKHNKYFIATFEVFVKVTKAHFATEERYMQEAQYSKTTEHKKEHDEFIQELLEYEKQIKDEDPGIHDKVLVFLKDWYSAHILGTDRDYIESFQTRGFK